VIALAVALVLSLQGEQPAPPQPAPEDIELLPTPAAPDAEWRNSSSSIASCGRGGRCSSCISSAEC